MTRRRVALVIPHFRQAEFLAACLESALFQTRRADEIIVVDSSPADTAEIMARYRGDVRHVITPARGVAAARNAGIAATRCDLVSFLDADNVATPDRLRSQERAFIDAPDAVLCHGAMILMDRKGAGYAQVPRFNSEQVAFERQLGWLIERNRVAADTVCVRRDALELVGGFCEQSGVREDYDLWLRLASVGPFRYLDAPLAWYRRHETNLSNNADYMFEWEAGALRRLAWPVIEQAVAVAFPDPRERAVVEGEVRLRRGEREAAERHFQAVFEKMQNSEALFHLAHIAVDRGDVDTAEDLLLRGIDKASSDAGLWNNLGVTLALQGGWTAARDAFERAASLRAHYDDAARNLEDAKRGSAGPWRLTRRRLRPELMPMAAAA
jgi:glycosyltransferase involved in cell wall biosynthesis